MLRIDDVPYKASLLRPSDIGCQYSRSIYTARFIVWQPVVLQTRRRINDRAFSVAAPPAPQAWKKLPTELKLLYAIDDSFHCDLKTFLFHSVYGHQDTD